MVSDVPLYSSSTFLVRGRLPGAAIDLSVSDVQAAGGQLQSLVLSTSREFPSTIREAAVLIGGRFYSLSVGDGVLVLGQPTGTVAHPRYRGDSRINRSFDPEFDNYREVDEAFGDLYEGLVLRSLGQSDRMKAAHFRLPPGRIRVFVYARTPDSLAVQIDEDADQIGYVLHTWDFATGGSP